MAKKKKIGNWLVAEIITGRFYSYRDRLFYHWNHGLLQLGSRFNSFDQHQGHRVWKSKRFERHLFKGVQVRAGSTGRENHSGEIDGCGYADGNFYQISPQNEER